VDSKNKKLIEIEAHPVAKVIVPGKIPPDKDQWPQIIGVIPGKGGPAPRVPMSRKTSRKTGK